MFRAKAEKYLFKTNTAGSCLKCIDSGATYCSESDAFDQGRCCSTPEECGENMYLCSSNGYANYAKRLTCPR